ncbi:MAG TPA: DUF1801 domain-containing protein [Pseudodesulfovibrio sp.]|nr:DUF1801 domain-containing protein [Pseudodesulfovibrio sp.]
MSSKKKTDTDGFTPEEKEAMKARAKELKAEARANKKREEGEKDLLEKVGEMNKTDKAIAMRIHEIVSEAAPELWPKTWYGMPAWSIEGKKIVCFFQSGEKFQTRYCTFGFQQDANMDDGNMWPTSWAITKLTAKEEKQIAALVKQAVS